MSDYNVLIYHQKEYTYRYEKYFNSWNSLKDWLILKHNTTHLKDKGDNLHMLSGYSSSHERKQSFIDMTAKWFAVDIDNFEKCSFKEVLNIIKPYEYIMYNSASCRQNDIRVRIVFPISRNIYLDEYKHFWLNFNTELHNIIDESTKHIERTQAVPATFEDSFNFICYNDGRVLDVDFIKNKYQYHEKDTTIKLKGLLQQRQKHFINNYSWVDYNDCPFVPKSMVDTFHGMYDTEGVGKYAYMYKIMCVIAMKASHMKYPISPKEIVDLCKKMDYNNKYKNRNWLQEAQKAILFALDNQN